MVEVSSDDDDDDGVQSVECSDSTKDSVHSAECSASENPFSLLGRPSDEDWAKAPTGFSTTCSDPVGEPEFETPIRPSKLVRKRKADIFGDDLGF